MRLCNIKLVKYERRNYNKQVRLKRALSLKTPTGMKQAQWRGDVGSKKLITNQIDLLG
jgi:hypothetical protein